MTFASTAEVVPLAGRSNTPLDDLTGAKLTGLVTQVRAALVPGGHTDLHRALVRCAAALDDMPIELERHVILVTDGRDTLSLNPVARISRIGAAARAVLESKAQLHIVRLRPDFPTLVKFTRRLREGGATLLGFLKEHTGRGAACVDLEPGSARAKRCGAYHASRVLELEGSTPVTIVPVTSAASEQTHLADSASVGSLLDETLSGILGTGVYARTASVRHRRVDAESVEVVDVWELDLDVDTEAAIVIYRGSPIVVEPQGWALFRDGKAQVLGRGIQLEVVGDTHVRLSLPRPARGRWRIERRGRLL